MAVAYFYNESVTDHPWGNISIVKKLSQVVKIDDKLLHCFFEHLNSTIEAGPPENDASRDFEN